MHGQSGFSDIRVNKGYISEIIPILLDLIGTATWQSTTFRPFWGPWGRDFWMKMSTKDNVNTVFPFQHQASSSNLHRHKKNQAQSHKTLAGPKKNKKTQHNFTTLCFFVLVPANILWDCAWFFFVPASVLRDQSHQTLAGTKKKLDAPNPDRHQKNKKQNPSIYSGFWTSIDWKFVFFCYFWCLPMFCEIMLCFLFFLVPANVFRASLQNKMQKCAVRLDFRATRCRKHR